MNEQPFTHQQLFGLKKSTLEKRIVTYYNNSGDSDATIQYLMTLLIRKRLGDEEFDLFLSDLVHHLFMERKVTKTVKKFFFYFKEYFHSKEWKYLLIRYFPIRQYAEKIIKSLKKRTDKQQPLPLNTT
ncbi:hypothetical protein ACFFH2_14895 [Enterococcus devriesei]|nr:hypothetical protein [Enterococcus devriesei]MDU6524481.1 hypothetical protein [Enterococcus sp.]